jgi:hypothetical protein
MLKFLKISKWVFLSSGIILASLFVLHLIITPKDGGRDMLLGAIGCFGLYLRTVRSIKRITSLPR